MDQDPKADPHATLVLFRDGTIAETWGLRGDHRGRDLRELPLTTPTRERILERLRSSQRFEIDDPEAPSPLRLVVLVLDALPLRISVVSVRALLLRTMEVFSAQARAATIELTMECSPEVPATLHGDSEKLAWLLATLVGNAVRLVQGAAEVEPRVFLRADWIADTGEVTFRVTDNGPGLSPDVARWLFERDPRTGRPAGLALAMARDVARAHSGSIEVEARERGQGASFLVKIPRVAPATDGDESRR